MESAMRDRASCDDRRRGRRHRTAVGVFIVALTVSGCAGGVALNRSFNDYAGVVADLNNRQLLLNLARMANVHPPHFLQLGLINASYQFGATAAGNVGEMRTSGVPPSGGGLRLLQKALQWGANLGATFGEQPTFTFTPLSGPQFASGFLAPIAGSVFFTLLDQGEHIDQLMRALVQAIEFTDPTTGKRVTFVNLPDADNADTFIMFLRFAGMAAELQRHQLIRTETKTSTTPVPSPPLDLPKLEDMLKLAEKGLTVQPAPGQPGKYVLASSATSTALLVAPDAADVWVELSKQPYYRIGPPAKPGAPAAPPPTAPPPFDGFTMKMRSFFEVLSWVAVEQEKFDALAAQPGFLENLPPSQRRPVLRLTWDRLKADDLEPPAVALQYGQRVYAITDVRGDTWNRDVFTLLSYISSQVSVNPKDLPVQQLINVR
jgi:hypothetical protein